MFFRKRQSRLAEVGHTLSDVAHTLSDTGHHLSERVQDTLRHAPEKLGDLRETVGGAVSHVGEAVSHVGEAVSHLRGSVGAIEPKLENVRAAVANAQKKAQNAQKKAQEQAVAGKKRLLPCFRGAVADSTAVATAAGQYLDDRLDRDHEQDNSSDYSKFLWLGLGIVIGVIIGLLMAPASGRRSRAVVKDKLNKGRHAATDAGAATVGKVVDVGHRAQGLAHKVEGKLRGSDDDADDNTVADRVRTALGQHEATRHLDRLNIDVVDGVVTVRGPLVETAVREAIETVVRGIKGVREVQSELLEDSDEDSATFVG
jgi:gas vesicle protein